MLQMNRSVEEGVAENLPAVAAAMVANRWYDARFCTGTWPEATRKFYLANTLASTMAAGSGTHSLYQETEYWAALMDVFPEGEFNVLGDHAKYEPVDGAQAKEIGYVAGYTSDDRPISPGRSIWTTHMNPAPS